MMPKRVLILIDRLGRGGVAQVALNTALTLDTKKYEPIICTTRDKPQNGQDEILRGAGIQLIELNRRSRMQILSWGPLMAVLPTVSILHSHLSGSNFWARLWGAKYKVPVVITQEHTAVNEKHKLNHAIDRLMSPLSDKIVTVSEFDRQQYIKYEKLPEDKVVTIYNGIDTTRFKKDLSRFRARNLAGLPKDKNLFGLIGRLANQKNHLALLKAFERLPTDIQDKSLCVFIGSGEREAFLREKVVEMNLKNQVVFLGERHDIPIILQALDLLVLPSHWECLPMIIVEALAAKCPVVATSVGGVPEIVGNIGWLLVPPGDVDSLLSSIMHVLEMPVSEKDHIRDAGAKRVNSLFSKDVSVSQLEKLYDSLLASNV